MQAQMYCVKASDILSINTTGAENQFCEIQM